MAGAPLRLGDLRHRHLVADGIAQAEVVVALAPGGPGGREVEPHLGRDVILGHALPPVVHEPEQLLRARIALLRGALVPRGGQHVVLRQAAPRLVHEADPGLRPRVAAYRPDARPMTLPPSSAADAAPTVVRAKSIAARMTIALRMLVPLPAPKVAHYREPMRRRQGARGRWPRGAGVPVALRAGCRCG